MNKLVCPECRHENEPERVYCHNCGARLDRSVLTNEKSTPKENLVETQKRLRRIFSPRGTKVRHTFFNLCKLILGAFAAAVLIQVFLPPDLPPRLKTAELGPQLGLDIETAVTDRRGATLSYSEDQVNSYLATALKRKKAVLEKPFLQFEAAFAGFDEGTFQLTAERSFLGYSFYTRAAYQVKAQDGKLVASNCGGSIGRMPIHPEIMKYAEVVVADVWKALEQDRKQVAKLAAIEFHSKIVVLTAPTQ
jgi:hypothetical protein